MILSGWKEIAGYLHCGVRTVQRWEADGLPVHRPSPAKRSHVVAHSEELDRWVRNGYAELGYPKLNASIAQATKLQGQARTRLEELHRRVSLLRDIVIELQARRRNRISPAISMPEIYGAGNDGPSTLSP